MSVLPDVAANSRGSSSLSRPIPLIRRKVPWNTPGSSSRRSCVTYVTLTRFAADCCAGLLWRREDSVLHGSPLPGGVAEHATQLFESGRVFENARWPIVFDANNGNVLCAVERGRPIRHGTVGGAVDGNPKAAQGKRDFVRGHAACGVVSNICTDLIVTKSKGKGTGETTQFEGLLNGTNQHFDISEVLADKAYSTQAILQAVGDLGAVPWIPYKSNTVAKTGPAIWKKMFYYFRCHEEKFAEHYHKRSNVESMFNMVKAKFGGSVRSKDTVSQANEVYLKVLCHNIVVLTHSIYEYDLVPEFWKGGSTDEETG